MHHQAAPSLRVLHPLRVTTSCTRSRDGSPSVGQWVWETLEPNGV